MTIEDAKEVTEVVKEKLKENGDVYSEHILAYVSYLEKQIEKMKVCGNCKNYIQNNNYVVGLCCLQDSIEGNNLCDKWEFGK